MTEDETRPVTAVDRVMEDFLAQYVALNPIAATETGISGHETQLPDLSPDGLAEEACLNNLDSPLQRVRMVFDLMATDSPDDWASIAGIRQSRENTDGEAVVDIGSGGTIPFVAQFADTFPAAAILVTSAGGDPDFRAHGVDESLHLREFEWACLAEALLLAELANWAASTQSSA